MNPYRKGANGERELARILSDMFSVECHRYAQPYLCGYSAPDVCGVPGIHIECKRRDKLSLYAAMRQSASDSRGDIPIVASRANHEPWLITVRLEDLPELAKKIRALLK